MKRLAMNLLALVLLGLAGCGSPPPTPPEGLTLALRFVSIDIAIVEKVRLSFRPQNGARFQDTPEQMLEDGAIVMRVETDGTLTMEVSGDYVRAHATDTPDGTQKLLELHVWSDDPMMREGPLVFAFADRSGEAIGEAMAYLPTWPPPLEVDGGCTPAGQPCRTQLAITCTMVDRCR